MAYYFEFQNLQLQDLTPIPDDQFGPNTIIIVNGITNGVSITISANSEEEAEYIRDTLHNQWVNT